MKRIFMKRILLLLSTLAAFMSISAMEKPEIKPVAKEKVTTVASTVYYTPENLQRLYAQGAQRHAPLLILFDPVELDNLGAITLQLASAIRAREYPIIASSVLLSKLLKKAIESDAKPSDENAEFRNLSLTFDNWNLHITPSSALAVLIPKKFSKMFPDLGIKISSIANVSNLLPGALKGKEKIKDFLPLIEDLGEEFPAQGLIKDFSRIFFTKNELDPQKLPIWDILISGHGLPKPVSIIAGMPPEALNKILSFFDTDLNVGTVMIDSCMSGGENLNFLEFEQSGAPKNHPYILIVASVSDSPTIIASTGYLKGFWDFFNLAAQLSDKGESLNALLRIIPNSAISQNISPEMIPPAAKNILSVFVRQSPNIPQVWLPNTKGFQTFNIDQYVFVLGKVTAQVGFENKKPIIIKDKKVVLIYPYIVKVPLFVLPWVQKNVDPTMINTYLAKTLTWGDMPLTTEPAFWALVDPARQKELGQIIQTDYPILPRLYERPDFSYVFPQFISMTRGDTAQIFSHIIISNPKMPTPMDGMIRFIRDAFLDISKRTTRKTFLIEKLQGYNDISLLIQTARIAKSIKDIHPLEILLASKKNQLITLENVIIETQYDLDTDQNIISVSFKIDNSSWQFSSNDIKNLWPQTYLWNLRQIDPYMHFQSAINLKQKLMFQSDQPNIYEQLPQKSISQVLKQKQEAIILKKAVEVKRKEAAESAVKKYKEAALATQPAQEESKK